MAARLQTDFYSETGTKYTVIIYDSGYLLTPATFTATKLELRYNGSEDKRVTPIITSELLVNILVQDSTIDTFVSQLVNAQDQRFTVKVNKDDAFFWCGIVKTDSVSLEDMSYDVGYNFSLVATDGLGLLRDEPHRQAVSTPYTGWDTLLTHVFTALEKIGLNDFWGASDDYFVILNNWQEKTVTHTTSSEPLDYLEVHNRAFYEQDGDTLLLKSSYEVLEAIMTIFNLRLMLSGGAWRALQPSYQAESGLVAIRAYDKSQNVSVTTDNPFNIWDKNVGEVSEYAAGTKDLYKITSGGYQYLPALDSVTVAYAHNSTANAVRYDDITTSTTIEDVDYNGGNATLALQGNFIIDIEFVSTFFTHWEKYKLTIQIGSYYLKRSATVNSNNNTIYSDVEWTTTPSTYDILQAITSPSMVKSFSVFSPPLPESGDITIQIEDYGNDTFIYFGGGTISSGAIDIHQWSLENVYLEIFADGNPEGQSNTTYYTATNDTSGNKAKLEVTTILGGATHPNSFGRMRIAATGANATIWNIGGVGTDVNLQQLIANDLINGQLSPVEKMVSQSFYGDYEAHETMVRNSKKYLLLSGVLDMGKDIWSGQWFYLTAASSGSTPGDEEDSPEIIVGEINLYLNAPSNGTPGQALLNNTIKDIDVQVDTDPENAVITLLQTGIVKNTEYEEIAIPIYHPGDLWIEGDSVVIKNPITGQQQDFTTSKIGHDTGNDAVLVAFEAANYDFDAGSFITPDPLEQQYNISFGRRKFLQYHLVDLSTDFTTSATYITYGKFFRPPGDDTSSDSTDFVNRLYLRKVHWLIGDNPSASSSIQYTARVVRGSTPTVVASTTLLGTDTYKTVDINDGEQLLFDDIYKFQVKKDDSSGLDENTGLVCMLELFNKVFEPDDIIDLWCWLRPDYNVTIDGSNNVSTWADAYSSSDFVQIGASDRPAFVENVKNGYPGIVFDNHVLYNNSGLDISSNNYSIFIAFNSGTFDAVNGNTIFCQWDGSGQYEFLKIDTSGQLVSTVGGITLVGDTINENTDYIASLTFDGTNQRIYINGFFEGANTPTISGTPGNMRLGDVFSGSDYFEGTIYEVIIYGAEMPAARRQLAEAYLSKKFDIPLGQI